MWIGFTQLIRALSDAQPIALVSRLEQLTQMQVKTGDRVPMGYRRYGHKIAAARIALPVSNSDHEGRFPGNIERILQETQFELPQLQPSSARKRWIAHGLIAVGQLYLDQGAVTAICQAGSLC